MVREAARQLAPPLAPERSRVLLAEDNVVNQKVCRLLLSKLGHHVETVSNGREALEALRQVPYDVVLINVQMPVMDGLEAARRIRAELPARAQPRIVALTANVHAESREACTGAGMGAFLAKPVRTPDLAAALAGSGSGPDLNTARLNVS